MGKEKRPKNGPLKVPERPDGQVLEVATRDADSAESPK